MTGKKIPGDVLLEKNERRPDTTDVIAGEILFFRQIISSGFTGWLSGELWSQADLYRRLYSPLRQTDNFSEILGSYRKSNSGFREAIRHFFANPSNISRPASGQS